jgi:hypothetical protein
MEPASLWALTVAAIYFGSTIATGIALRKACDWLMGRVGVGLDDVQAQAGPNRGVRDAFVLGWRSKR